MEQNALKSEIQRFVCSKLDDLGMTQRGFTQAFPEYSTSTYGTWRRQEVAMGLDVLEKILSKYPDIKMELVGYLSGNTDKNITDGVKPAISKDEELLQVYRDNVAMLKNELKEAKEKIQLLEKQLGDDKKKKARPAHN